MILGTLPLVPSMHASFLRRNHGVRENRILRWRRRRRRLEFRAESHFEELIRSLPYTDLAAAVGLVSGSAVLFLSSLRGREQKRGNRNTDADNGVVGDWVLFTSPTPFNRCVLLRCPSVCFEDGGELLDGVSDRLVREERHYVNLTRGRIPLSYESDLGLEDEIFYQRVCVGTKDGGVISLDWPENLDLGREHGLDTTVLIVPGTAEGSMGRNVKMFVYDALRHGYFPIVMNPRGCAGSPLTTARLFTAADSDDICTAIQFLNRLRPWTTLVSVGWGYGANMLTKYLAEVGERTPLAAAVCIDNPFDLEEATRSCPHHVAMDQKLTGGLIDILRANKELFQGKTKRFDVAKGLSATSVRDFDVAVSMVSYGCDAVEDFYSKSSTRQLISSVKIPILFMQSDDGTVPLFSVPRSSIAENPFTSLLLCSSLPSIVVNSERSVILWCQHLAIEWLSAVELGLLKGRHPLLKDVDITINLSSGLRFVDGKASERSTSAENRTNGSSDLLLSRKMANGDSLWKLTDPNHVNSYLLDELNESEGAIQNKGNSLVRSGKELNETQGGADVGSEQAAHPGVLQQNNVHDTSETEGRGGNPNDGDQSQALQSATVVMNMLDITMPGTLDDDQKKKVLIAVGQGETFVRALQGAVPEDVRGKLTTAVTDIFQTQGTRLNLDGLKRLGWIPNESSNVMTGIQQKLQGLSTFENGDKDSHSSEQVKKDLDSDGTIYSSNQTTSDENSEESTKSFEGKPIQASEFAEAGSEGAGDPRQPSKLEKAGGAIGQDTSELLRDEEINVLTNTDSGDNFNSAEQKILDSTAEENCPISSNNATETFGAGSSPSEQQVLENEGNVTHKDDDEVNQEVANQSSASSSTKVEDTPKTEDPSPQQNSSPMTPSINVNQAFEALSGFDDSTQMAINSVFGVLEGMIDELEKTNDQGNDVEADKKVDPQSAVAELPSISDGNNELSSGTDLHHSSNQPHNSFQEEAGAESCRKLDDKFGEDHGYSSLTAPAKNPVSLSQDNNAGSNHLDNFNSIKFEFAPKFPIDIAMQPYWDSSYGMHPHKYLSSQQSVVGLSDSDSTTELILDPEEGSWKMLDQASNSRDTMEESGENQHINEKVEINHSLSYVNDVQNILEPSYVILDTENSSFEKISAEEDETFDDIHNLNGSQKAQLMHLVKSTLLEALNVELSRRLSVHVLKEIKSDLSLDMEQVADEVAEAILCDNALTLTLLSNSKHPAPLRLGTVDAEKTIRAIYSAVQGASHLRKVLPVGVIVGSSLASLRKYFQVAVVHNGNKSKVAPRKTGSIADECCHQESGTVNGLSFVSEVADSDDSVSEGSKSLQAVDCNSDGIMVKAVTAALGASALLAHRQRKNIYGHDGAMERSSHHPSETETPNEEPTKLEEELQDKNQNNLVSTLAEKAVSVASPVVPTKSDGEVDHERLVSILAELGQKGGMLRLLGKIALLWGGMRGAMSLTDRLISLLHIAERPLYQRVLGFICMALVLWSPVVIPLVPTLVRSWTAKTSNGLAKCACVIGLYVAIMILVMLWGKRIRGYDNPLEKYGLALTSAYKEHNFLKGLIGGTAIVLFIHSINASIGSAQLTWPSILPSSSAGAIVLVKAYGNMLALAARGSVIALGTAVVEELLFRSWLLEEVAVDFGYYRAVMLSGIAFALVQRSLSSVPGFLLLSLALFGIKQRSHGSLSAPIGMRIGIMTTNFVLHTGDLLKYQPSSPFWLISNHPWHPFEGAVGLLVSIILALSFFPRQPLQTSSDELNFTNSEVRTKVMKAPDASNQ